jgi:DNA modification methylase
VTPFYADDWLTVYGGDCREVMRSMEPESVHCVVTSPPYWGLRDYGDAGQLGLEPTPEEYVANMVEVFREVRRVLRSDGTVWLNLGDSYAGGGGFAPNAPSNLAGSKQTTQRSREGGVPVVSGLKPKDLVGIPWRVAFALQADGWYLRSDIIWSKPNPMPESVTDRPTKSHEYLFLLTKSPRYYFDQEGVREPEKPWNGGRINAPKFGPERLVGGSGAPGTTSKTFEVIKGANIRSVWTIATRPYPGAHFAVFPPELPERCIKAGSSEKGVCPECGAPWERTTERNMVPDGSWGEQAGKKRADAPSATVSPSSVFRTRMVNQPITTGWRPTCQHGSPELCQDKSCPLLSKGVWGHPLSAHDGWGEPRLRSLPATVLDPFAGSGTVGMVANRLSRRAILIDLNPEYLKQQMARNAQTPLGLGAA